MLIDFQTYVLFESRYCSSWGPYSRDSLNSGVSNALGLWSEETTYCEAKMTEDEAEEVYSHEDIVDSFKEESIEEEVNLENIDDFVEDNLGQTDNKEEEFYSHENIVDSVKKSSMEEEVNLENIDDFVEDNLDKTDNKEEEIYSHENILDSVKKSSMEEEVKLEVIDDLVEDNLGQPIPLVMVKDKFMEEKYV